MGGNRYTQAERNHVTPNEIMEKITEKQKEPEKRNALPPITGEQYAIFLTVDECACGEKFTLEEGQTNMCGRRCKKCNKLL